MRKRGMVLLLSLLLLLTAACSPGEGGADGERNTDISAELEYEDSMELLYAEKFSVDYYTGGFSLVTVNGSERYLVVPEGKESPGDLAEDITVLYQPLDRIYLVASAVMDMFISMDSLDVIRFTGTKAASWYLEEAREAVETGDILYAGNYSAPDYEQILAEGCDLAIENTMVYHTPEVKEQLEKFGVPVLVERSSYESGPLARMEWLKLYGILLNKTEMAEEVFRQKVEQVAPILEQENTGKTAAFFSITTNNLITVRRTSDYVAQMVGMAGGVYIFDDLEGETSAQSTIKLPLETFYARAKDADVLIYNSTIEGVMETRDQLIEKCPMLADFKAVQSGDCWCTAQSLFQQSMELADLISDMNLVFTEGSPDPASLRFLQRIV